MKFLIESRPKQLTHYRASSLTTDNEVENTEKNDHVVYEMSPQTTRSRITVYEKKVVYLYKLHLTRTAGWIKSFDRIDEFPCIKRYFMSSFAHFFSSRILVQSKSDEFVIAVKLTWLS